MIIHELIILLTLIFVCNNFIVESFYIKRILTSNTCMNRVLELTSISKKYSDVLKYLRNDQPKEIFEKPEVLEDLEVIETIVKTADSRKANDITVLNLRGLSDMTDYVIIMDGNNKPQTQALLSIIEEELLSKHGKKGKVQGDAGSGWALLDYGSIIVNVMFPKMRNFYKLEKKWKDAEKLDISHLISERKNTEEIDDEYVVKDETNDPFWNDF